MNKITYFLVFLLLLSGINYTLAQGSIIVEVNGIQSEKGEVNIGLYSDKDNFPEFGHETIGVTLDADTSGLTHTFVKVPSDTYAISVFHDKNKNKKLDKNWVGIPKEDYGFSKNKRGSFGPPSFEEVSFTLSGRESKTFTITIK